jgi:hypothetical protein
MAGDDMEVEVGSFPIGQFTGDPSEIMSRIRDAVQGVAGGDVDERQKPDPAMALEILMDVYRRYIKSYGQHMVPACPYKPGDLVTAPPTSTLNGVGEPHVVLETRVAEPDYDSSESGPSSSSFGRRADVRVACLVRGKRTGSWHTVAHWCESYEFIPYSP